VDHENKRPRHEQPADYCVCIRSWDRGFTEVRLVFYTDLTPSGHRVLVIEENKPGYRVCADCLPSLAIAQEFADRKNKQQRLSADDIAHVIMSSMRAGHARDSWMVVEPGTVTNPGELHVVASLVDVVAALNSGTVVAPYSSHASLEAAQAACAELNAEDR
jgi:hypothetical protein